MEVFLYNSTVCRLCSEENDNGTLLYSSEENNQSLSDIINTFLPLKVSDDGQLPRTICPGCTIQLEATVEFLNLIINGQKVIRELYQREKEYKKSLGTDFISENIVYEIKTSNGVYQVEHPIALQVSGLDKPKRKRGRPKKHKGSGEISEETTKNQVQETIPVAATNEAKTVIKEDEEFYGKRRRKTPTRFKEAVQGKELERIFLETGVIDEVESDHNVKPDPPPKPQPKERKVIGHLEDSGELVVVLKGKGRGRPRGRMQPTHEVCGVCGMSFNSVGRYMSHMAAHARDVHARAKDQEKPQLNNVTDNVEVANANGTVEHCNIPAQKLPDLTIETTVCKSEYDDALKPEDTGQNVIEIETVDNKESLAICNDGANNESTDDVEENETEGDKSKLKCKFCDKLYSTRQGRSVHIKAVHLGERSHACGECGAKFAYPRSLALHRLSHRRERHAGYGCDVCGKVLNHPSSVVYHKQTEHDPQRFVCGTCGKRFRHRQLLQRHQLVHSELRPFVCKICNSSFKTRPNMMNHQLLHTGVKKFSCEICKARFAHKTSLTLHMRWHTGIKPFACNVCTKGFSQKGNLVEHMRIHTGEKPYSCKQCPRRFTTSSQHRLHQRRHAQQRAALRDASAAARNAASQAAQKNNTFVRNKPGHKQMSLLVDKNPERQQPKPQTMAAERAQRESSSDRVIYVAFEAGDNMPAFEIIDPAQVTLNGNKELNPCELYTGSSLLVPQPLGQHEQLELEGVQLELESEKLELETEQLELQSEELEMESEQMDMDSEQLEMDSEQLEMDSEPLELETETLELDSEQLELDEEDLDCKIAEENHISVTDAEGNPLHFTMQDGTRLAITSLDGQLQVITQDGQTIPVEINGYAEQEVQQYYTIGSSNVWKK